MNIWWKAERPWPPVSSCRVPAPAFGWQLPDLDICLGLSGQVLPSAPGLSPRQGLAAPLQLLDGAACTEDSWVLGSAGPGARPRAYVPARAAVP